MQSAAVLGDKWRLRGTVSVVLVLNTSGIFLTKLAQLLLILDVFAVIGYAILLGVSGNPGVRYFACFLIAIPLYCGPGLNEICKSMQLVIRRDALV